VRQRGTIHHRDAFPDACPCTRRKNRGNKAMRGILLWLIGIPIPIIILLYLFDVL
jgi:hypothetical protein